MRSVRSKSSASKMSMGPLRMRSRTAMWPELSTASDDPSGGYIRPAGSRNSSLARHARKVPLVRDAQRDEIRMINAKFFRDTVDLAFFCRRDSPLWSRPAETDTSHQRKLLVSYAAARRTPSRQEMWPFRQNRRVARLRQFSPTTIAVSCEQAVPCSRTRRFHDRRFLFPGGWGHVHGSAHGRRATSRYAKRGEVACTVRREMIQRLERLAERRTTPASRLSTPSQSESTSGHIQVLSHSTIRGYSITSIWRVTIDSFRGCRRPRRRHHANPAQQVHKVFCRLAVGNEIDGSGIE